MLKCVLLFQTWNHQPQPCHHKGEGTEREGERQRDTEKARKTRNGRDIFKI